MSEKEREQELFNRIEKRELLKTRYLGSSIDMKFKVSTNRNTRNVVYCSMMVCESTMLNTLDDIG